MKKIWFLMLTMCMACTFTACSDSDDDNPVNTIPVSGVSVPSTGKVGSEIIVTGSGFSSSLTLYLESGDKTRTQLSATYTNAGATFTVPFTVAPGSYTLIATQGNDEWTLGTITLQEADCPINAILMPEGTLVTGKEITIGGSGYESTDKVVLQTTDNTQVEVSDLTASNSGLSFTIPTSCAEGTYTVILQRGESSWELGSVEIQKQRRVTSLYADMYGGAMGMTLNMEYDTDGKLTSISSDDDMVWQFSYTETTISTTSVMTGLPLVYTIANGRIESNTAADWDENVWEFKWEYTDGYLSSITNDEYGLNHYFTRDATGNITTYSGVGESEFTYNDDALKAIPYTIEPAVAVNFMMLFYSKEDMAIGCLTGMTGSTSSLVPSTISDSEQNDDGSYTTIACPIDSKYTTNNGETELTMQCSMPSLGGDVTVIITYETVE